MQAAGNSPIPAEPKRVPSVTTTLRSRALRASVPQGQSVRATASLTRLPGTDFRLDELPAGEPRFIQKMDCIAVNDVAAIPSGRQWLREIKWDGYRICVIKRDD